MELFWLDQRSQGQHGVISTFDSASSLLDSSDCRLRRSRNNQVDGSLEKTSAFPKDLDTVLETMNATRLKQLLDSDWF